MAKNLYLHIFAWLESTGTTVETIVDRLIRTFPSEWQFNLDESPRFRSAVGSIAEEDFDKHHFRMLIFSCWCKDERKGQRRSKIAAYKAAPKF